MPVLNLPPFMPDSHSDNVAKEWEQWKDGFEIYLVASGIKNTEQKKALLLHFAGREVREIYQNLPEVEMRSGPLLLGYVSAKDSYQQAKARLDEYYLPKKNRSYERYLFRELKQDPGEKISAFVIRLRQQAEKCGFENGADDHIIDQLTQRCSSSKLRRRILEKGEMKLDVLLTMAKAMEIVDEQEKVFGNPLNRAMLPETVSKIDMKLAPKL